MKKKMLHVIEAAGGGALQYLIDICNHLPTEEWDIEIVYSRRNVTPANMERLFKKNVHLIEYEMTREISLKKDFRAYVYLFKKFREKKWDIIHLHSSKAGALGRMAAKGLNIPILFTPHGFSFYQQDILAFKRKIYFAMEKVLDKIKKAEFIVSSTNEFNDSVKLTGSSKRVKQISNSVSIPELDCLKSQDMRQNEHYIITVGRLTSAKNPLLYLDIVEAVTKEMPDTQFVWIGDGELHQSFESEMEKRNLSVIMPGWLQKEQVNEWYKNCTVYIQTSLWEGLPLAVLEAMSYGCALVLSNIPAHEELVQNEQNGVIATSLEEYKQSIIRLLKNPEINRKMGDYSRTIIKNNYGLDRFMSEFAAYYNELHSRYNIRNKKNSKGMNGAYYEMDLEG